VTSRNKSQIELIGMNDSPAAIAANLPRRTDNQTMLKTAKFNRFDQRSTRKNQNCWHNMILPLIGSDIDTRTINRRAVILRHKHNHNFSSHEDIICGGHA